MTDMLESIRPFLEDNVSNRPKPAVATPLNPRRRGIVIGASDGIGAALARRLAREEGIFTGVSAGLNVAAAMQIARELGRGHTVVTAACDTGLKYLAGDLFRDDS